MTHTDDRPWDVCIVGAGPTGLTLAHLLALRGVKVLVLEREPQYYGMARAVYTDDECLRIMQNAGLADELHAEMSADLPVQWSRADGSLLAQFHDPSRRNGWPTANFLYQPDLEQTLERRLADHPGVRVLRGRAVLQVSQDAHAVTITHQQCTGASYGRAPAGLVEGTLESSRASYLVAADGGRSTVRTVLGITMHGTAFPQRWLVLDLLTRPGVDAFAHLPYFDFVCDPNLPTVSCPQPKGRHRFEFMLHDDDVTADFETPQRARDLLAQYVNPDEVVIDRQLVYTFNALIADRWREGRVLLAGDAAHMTPQFIGQGMNSGLRDADNLSWKLADVVLRGACSTLLDSYQAERRPHAKAMIDLSVFNKNLVSTQHPAAIRARDWGLAAGVRMPGLRKLITEAKLKPRPRFQRTRFFGLPRRGRGVEGTLLPQPVVRTRNGHLMRLDDCLGTGWVLLGLGVDPRAQVDLDGWRRIAPTWARLYESGRRPQGRRERVGTDRPPSCSEQAGQSCPLVDLETCNGSFAAWLRRGGLRPGSIIVLRPDKYVFAVLRPGQRTDTAALRALSATYPATRPAARAPDGALR